MTPFEVLAVAVAVGASLVASGFLAAGAGVDMMRTSGNGRSVETQPLLQTATATNEKVKTDRMRAASSVSDAHGVISRIGQIEKTGRKPSTGEPRRV